jgi:hypothetical protein
MSDTNTWLRGAAGLELSTLQEIWFLVSEPAADPNVYQWLLQATENDDPSY